MAKSSIFISAEKRQVMVDWCERFRQRIRIATVDRVVTTAFGFTHALVAGPENAPPLVVLHGAMASSAHMLPEIEPLLANHRVYAIDIIGQSAWSEDRRLDVRSESYGRWLLESCSQLGLRSYDLAGVSWGGFVALQGARMSQTEVRRLLLLVPAGFVTSSVWVELRQVAWPLLLYRAFPSQARVERFMSSQFTTLDPDWTAYFADALRCYRLNQGVPPVARTEELSSLRCPTLVIGAEHDVHFPGAALLERAKRLLPQAELELLRGSRHCPPLTPQFRAQLSARVERFLSGG